MQLDVDGNDFTSAGDVKFVVDSDSNTADSAFIIENGAGTVLWKINESGITSGLLTTTTPTLSGAASSYSQSSSVTGISVSNHVAGRTYKANIYNSSGTVQTGLNPVVDSSGNVTFTAPASTGTGFELRIAALDDGKFESVEVTATFEVTASRTFEYWRVQCVDSSGNASANKAGFVELDFYTGANATGTETPKLTPRATQIFQVLPFLQVTNIHQPTRIGGRLMVQRTALLRPVLCGGR